MLGLTFTLLRLLALAAPVMSESEAAGTELADFSRLLGREMLIYLLSGSKQIIGTFCGETIDFFAGVFVRA